MSNDGLSLEKQVELMGEVVHNHSNEIDEINAKCYKAFGMVEDDMYSLSIIDDSLGRRVDAVEGSVSGAVLWTTLGLLATGIIGFLGYNAWKDHEERLEKVEKSVKKTTVFTTDKVDDVVENPKMA